MVKARTSKRMVSHALLRLKLPWKPAFWLFGAGCGHFRRAATVQMPTKALDYFSSNYQSVKRMIEGFNQACLPYSAVQYIWRFGCMLLFARLSVIDRESNDVNLALRLDVLAVLAVFAFVGAILLGVF
jgi:hypothetical protein